MKSRFFSEDLFRSVGLVQVRDLGSIPLSARGVYAWFSPTPDFEVDGAFESHLEFYDKFFPEIRRENVSGVRYDVELTQPWRSVPNSLESELEKWLSWNLLIWPVICSGPLYIGKAVGTSDEYGLRKRLIAEKSEPSIGGAISDIIRRVNFVDFVTVEDCWIGYFDIREFTKRLNQGYEEDSVDQLAKWVEAKALSLSFPWLNKKKGN